MMSYHSITRVPSTRYFFETFTGNRRRLSWKAPVSCNRRGGRNWLIRSFTRLALILIADCLSSSCVALSEKCISLMHRWWRHAALYGAMGSEIIYYCVARGRCSVMTSSSLISHDESITLEAQNSLESPRAFPPQQNVKINSEKKIKSDHFTLKL